MIMKLNKEDMEGNTHCIYIMILFLVKYPHLTWLCCEYPHIQYVRILSQLITYGPVTHQYSRYLKCVLWQYMCLTLTHEIVSITKTWPNHCDIYYFLCKWPWLLPLRTLPPLFLRPSTTELQHCCIQFPFPGYFSHLSLSVTDRHTEWLSVQEPLTSHNCVNDVIGRQSQHLT